MIILAGVGLVLVAVAVVDQYVTTIAVRGGGPLSSRVVDMLWRPAVRSRRMTHAILSWYGTLMVAAIVLTWIVLLYTGWSLVFLSHPDAVVSATTGEPVGLWERLYFTGYVVTTLGNGELRPGGLPWQIGTLLAALSGLGVITLAITFIMPVLGAVVHKRQVARTIHGFGATPADIVANGWDGTGFTALATHLANLVPELASLAQQHMAYPVLHHFHSEDRRTALAPMIAVLDDALTLLRYGVKPKHRLDAITLRATAEGVEVLLEALGAAHIDPSSDPPDEPSIDILRGMDIPTVADDEYADATSELAQRRCLLIAFVASDGWHWGQ